MTLRKETFEVKIEASPEEVWHMLTTAEGLASWFGTEASIDFVLGGTRTVGWAGVSSFSCVVESIDELKRLVLTYTDEGEVGAAEEWLIESDGTTTHLRLVHSMPDDGIDDWEGFYGDMQRGWRLFMNSMKFALEEAATPERTVEAAHPPTQDRPATWDRIKAILDRSEDLVGEMRVYIEDPPHQLVLVASDRSLAIDQEGSGEHHVIYIQAATHGGPDEWRQAVIERFSSAGT